MADWSVRKIGELTAGDLVMSHRGRAHESAQVLSVLRQTTDRVLVRTASGREIICTPDHVFRVDHHKGPTQRRKAPASELLGYSLRVTKLERHQNEPTPGWWRGWAKGLILGDGHVGVGRYPKVWLRVTDLELAEAYASLIRATGSLVEVHEQKRRTKRDKPVYSVVHVLSRAPWLTDMPAEDELAGFIAGFFDAEGSVAKGGQQLELAQVDSKVLDRVERILRSFGFAPGRGERRLVINGRAEVCRFFNWCAPVLERKTERAFRAQSLLGTDEVVEVSPHTPGEVVNLTTTTGLFFAGGALVEQCDTPFTWDWKGQNGVSFDPSVELRKVALAEIAAWVEERSVPLVVITGGEPLIQRRAVEALCDAIHADVEIETNGTLEPGLALG